MKFFHSIATRNFRHNKIAALTREDGFSATEHEHKVAILWNAFDNSLEKSDSPTMAYDLSSMITPQNLEELEIPFSKEEIDDICRVLDHGHRE